MICGNSADYNMPTRWQKCLVTTLIKHIFSQHLIEREAVQQNQPEQQRYRCTNGKKKDQIGHF